MLKNDPLVSRKYTLLFILAVVHFSIVIIGASGRSFDLYAPNVEKIVYAYHAFTGSDNGFGFFAPGVSSETKPVIRVYDGKSWHKIESIEFPNKEAQLRLSTLVSLSTKDNFRDLLAASLAQWTFSQHSEMLVVIVEFQYFYLPPLSGTYAEPEWRTLQAYSFTSSERVFDYYGE